MPEISRIFTGLYDSFLLTNNLNRKFWPVVGTGRDVLNLAEGEHAINDPAKHDMLPVKEVAFGRCDEELEAEGQRSSITGEMSGNPPGNRWCLGQSWP